MIEKFDKRVLSMFEEEIIDNSSDMRLYNFVLLDLIIRITGLLHSRILFTR